MGHLKTAYYLAMAFRKGLRVKENLFTKGWTITLLSGYKIVVGSDEEMAITIKGA